MKIRRSAEISECGKYRWWLRRVWGTGGKGIVCFVMLNPSKADAEIDDNTIRRCMAFAIAWGYSGMVVVNLFAYRATNPKELLKVDSPVGGARNDVELLAAVRSSDMAIAAWGAKVPFRRDWDVRELMKGIPLYCLKTTKLGAPQHPLYMPSSATPQPFWNCDADKLQAEPTC